jgi:hypothetical protein
LSRAAQIRCSLWRRNGSSMIDQVCVFFNIQKSLNLAFI